MKRLIVTTVIFLLIISTAITSSSFIRIKIRRIEKHIDYSISHMNNEPEIRGQISTAIKEYEKSITVFMMFTEKELCFDLLKELKTAEFNVDKSKEKLYEALNNSKIVLERICKNQTFDIREIV